MQTPESLNLLCQQPTGSMFEIVPAGPTIRRLIVSTPESRRICNDPLLVGVAYTDQLMEACTVALRLLRETATFDLVEEDAVVLHILRGGLNFGLRQALAKACGWNRHASAFISAQRARNSDNPGDWYISENVYRKVNLPRNATIVFGDVVATGTSLLYALRQMLDVVEAQQTQVRSILFFCIGSSRAEEILSEIDSICRERFPGYQGATVLYFEGRFCVAGPENRQSIMVSDTDLLRTQSLLTPEFVDSQYDAPTYPIERCTIYDAGSRAYWLPEYYQDLHDYWDQTSALAVAGMTFKQLLAARFPELDAALFDDFNLADICRQQLERIP
jgi:uracil phosphoribosyltransferase